MIGLTQAVRRTRANPRTSYARYVPGPPHLRFHEDPSQTRLLRGPNQSGKTESGAKELVDRCLGKGRWQDVPAPPIRARVVCHSYKQSLAIQRKLWLSIPKHELDPRTHFDRVLGFRHKWIGFRNGSEVRVVTVGQDVLAHASETLDVVWIDEPPSPEVYAECQMRTLATGGVVFLTLTPIDRPVKWLWDLVEGKVPEDLEDLWDEGLRHIISEHHYQLSTDNCPWLSEDRVRSAISRCPVWHRPQRIKGEWEGLSIDRRLHAFTPSCVYPKTLRADEGWPGNGPIRLMLTGDHGELANHTAWFLLGYQEVGPSRRRAPRDDEPVLKPRVVIRVIAEYVNERATDDLEDAENLRTMVEGVDLRLDAIDWGVGDTNTGGKSIGGKKLNDLMTENLARLMRLPPHQPSFHIRSAWKRPGSVDFGIRLVNNQLKRGDLLICESCEGLIEAARHWEGEKSGDLPHRIDALRYGVVAIFREVDVGGIVEVF